MVRLFYTVTIRLRTGEVRTYSFGSRYDASTFLEEAEALGVTTVSLKISEMMSRKEAFSELKQLEGKDF